MSKNGSPNLTPIIIAILGILASLITWRWNYESRLAQENYLRREQQFAKLISCIHGFSTTASDKELRERFVKELDLCWLYCSDDVIKKSYRFLESVSTGSKATEEEQQKALGEWMLSIRKDLINNRRIKETKLEGRDFKFLGANP